MSWHRDPLALATPIGEHEGHDFHSAQGGVGHDHGNLGESAENHGGLDEGRDETSEDSTIAATPERVGSRHDVRVKDRGGSEAGSEEGSGSRRREGDEDEVTNGDEDDRSSEHGGKDGWSYEKQLKVASNPTWLSHIADTFFLSYTNAHSYRSHPTRPF